MTGMRLQGMDARLLVRLRLDLLVRELTLQYAQQYVEMELRRLWKPVTMET